MNSRELRLLIPDHCFSISPLRSWATLARLLCCLCLSLYLESNTDSLLLLSLVWIFHGQVLVGFFVLGHDCGHHTFSKSRSINQVIGLLSLAPLGNGYFTWQRTHNLHHAKTQLKGVDIDWSSWLVTKAQAQTLTWKKDPVRKLGYVLPFGIFWWVFWNALKRGLITSSIKERSTNGLMWLAMIGLYSGLFFHLGWWGLMKFHLIPATIAMITGYFLLIIQHANESATWYTEESWEFYRAQFGSTFDVRFPRFLEWLWLDINIHVPHHVFPQIPWYYLREASSELQKNHPHLYQLRKASYKELSWMIRTPFLVSDVKKGEYSISSRRI